MAYTKTTWQNGDLITAAKLNKLEQGVANIFHLLFPVHVEVNFGSTPKYTADKTYAEVCALMGAGRLPVYIFHINPSVGVIEGLNYHIPVSRESSRITIIDTNDDYVLHESNGVADGTR